MYNNSFGLKMTILRAAQSTSGHPSPTVMYCVQYADDATLTATIKVMMITEVMGVVTITNSVMDSKL